MSHLGKLILVVMRAASIGSAFFVFLVILIEVWKRFRFGGFASMKGPDVIFMLVLVVMLIGFVGLARSITREMRKY
jgi:hypothetical protein